MEKMTDYFLREMKTFIKFVSIKKNDYNYGQ